MPKVKGKRERIHAFQDESMVLRIGSEGDDVWFLQVMINGLARRFLNVAVIPLDGKYSSAMATTIGELQKLAGLPPTGETDSDTWDAIALVYNAHGRSEHKR